MTAPTRAWPLPTTPTPAPQIFPGAQQAAQALTRPENPAAVLRALINLRGITTARRILDQMQTDLTIAARQTHSTKG
jgi:hypothetical protein